MSVASKLPHPPQRPATHLSESHHLVRERQFPNENIAEIIRSLRESSATGTLSIDFANGGVGTIRFSERKKITLDTPE